MNIHINHLLAIHSIEHLNRFKKKQAKIATSGKQKVNDKFNTVKNTFSRSSQSNESAIWKREVLEGRRRELDVASSSPPQTIEETEAMSSERQKIPVANEKHTEGLTKH